MKWLIVLAGVAAVGGTAMAPRGDSASSAAKFELLKGLEGTWVSSDADGDNRPDVTATYRVTSGGSAVLETLFPGTSMEMLTIYHMDGGEIVCTHYCMLGNQPTLKIAKGGPENQIKLSLERCSNLAGPDAMCMAEAVLTFTDKNHLRTAWTAYEGSKRGQTHEFELTRQTTLDKLTLGLESHFIATVTTLDGKPIVEHPRWSEMREAHMAQLERLYDQGVLAACGPFSDMTGGVFILRADSEERARELLKDDAALDPALVKVSLRHWLASPALFTQGG